MARRFLALGLIAGYLFAPLPAVAAPPCCDGDCNADGTTVKVNELILMADIALGIEPFDTCRNGDCPCSGPADICDVTFLTRAVRNALYGCPQQ